MTDLTTVKTVNYLRLNKQIPGPNMARNPLPLVIRHVSTSIDTNGNPRRHRNHCCQNCLFY